MKELEDKYRGCFVGLAMGDTLGMSVEFESRGSFKPLTKPESGGPFDLPLGYWTDDTSMALCLADSLIEKGGYDSFDIMDKYCAWFNHGYRSSNGICFDIGNQVSIALNNYMHYRSAVVASDTEPLSSAGNGSIMRLAPVIIAAHASGQSLEEVMELARISGRETHYSREAEAGTALFGALLYNALTCDNKEDVFSYGAYAQNDQFTKIALAVSSAHDRTAETIDPTGYIVNSLIAAVWAFMNNDTFEEGALAAVNLGGDADTIGAIYGQLAGAFYGLQRIPESWYSILHQHEDISNLAIELTKLKSCRMLASRFGEDGDTHIPKKELNIYLDIDGVLLANDLNPANHAADFLKYILTNYPDSTYWLTTHCQGDASVPIQHIGHLFEPDVVELMKKIKPTSWDLAKTRAIDFDQQFLWFDDDLFHEEKETLIKHDALDNWIQVDLSKDPNQLKKFLTSFPLPV